ncbi:MAG: penicillin-binding transpeptidase domain-containing protein [Eubacteriales bacterium]|nr:penicillin-binding transpeptidase domain-containing protein [Eubacteriales bacterium]
MDKDNNKLNLRIIICAVIVIFIFAAFAIRLFDWQILNSDQYKEISAQSTSYTEVSDATRGEILDVNGKPLAVNKTIYNLVINKIYVQEDSTNDIISTLLDLCQVSKTKWIDVLPITVDGEAISFEDDSKAELEYILGESMLDDDDLETASDVLSALAQRYKADNIEDLQRRRDVISVRYNMEKTGYSYSKAYIFAEKISENAVAVISERTQTIAGVDIRVTNERVIKNGTLVPHILGVVGSLSAEEYEANKDNGYSMDGVIGKFGIEKALEEHLRGQAGTKTIVKDENGNIVSEKETVKAKPGDTVYLTIDSNVQQVANYSLQKNIDRARAEGENEVKSAKANNKEQTSRLGEDCYCGGAVMLSVKDNSVIAAASAPNYDISKYYDVDYNAWLNTNKHSPMFSRTFDGSFSPGSAFKPCVALAALQEKVIKSDTAITCTKHYDYYPKYVVNCMGTHGSISLHNAMTVSCNYYFADVGRRLGATTLYMYAEKFGLGVETGLEIDESTGVLAGRDSTTWYEGNTVQAAIGQSDNTFTPMQLATYVSTIANNGVRYKTHLVRKIVDYERDEVVLYNDPKKPTIMDDADISKKNLKTVKSSMRSVVTSGTATLVAQYPKSVAAKTGTAENAGSDHVIFVCYAPYEKPEVAVAVVLEHGAKGKYAMYTAMDMMDAYFYDKTLKQVKTKSWGY